MCIEKIIQDWLNEIHYDKPIMINKNSSTKTITITTTHPGILIGKSGKNIDTLIDRLNSSSSKWHVSLKEAHEIICTSNATIDTRDWMDILDERVKARLKIMYDM